MITDKKWYEMSYNKFSNHDEKSLDRLYSESKSCSDFVYLIENIWEFQEDDYSEDSFA